MTEPKHISESLKSILSNENVKTILNKEKPIHGVINEVLNWWSYDLLKRKPSPAYNHYGIFQGTDLDLACFLYALSGRGCIITLPTYKSHTKGKIRKDQVLLSKKNRNGQLLGVGSNQYFFSFNIKIIDQNVIGEDKVGDFRTFSLTDKEGNWYDGWRTIKFVPTLKENKFITENKLWTGNKIVFKNFIHPNRWTSFFGQHYVITKLLIDRLKDEASHYSKEVKRLLDEGITFPDEEKPEQYLYEYGEGVQKKFTAFECKIYIPDIFMTGNYLKEPSSKEGLVHAYTMKKYLRKIASQLQFMTRATEFAHFKAQDRFPSWIQNTKWENDFVIPKKRTKWQRLKLFQPQVGKHSVSILKRTFEKSATVSAG